MADNENKKEEGGEMTVELEQCRRERDEYLNGWKRAKADLVNFEREVREQTEMMVKFASESLLRELINVMDSFELAIKAEPENEGLKQVERQLKECLNRKGLKTVPAVGEKFDPRQHEAVMEEVAAGVETGTVIEEIEKGYQLYEKVIRPAKVKIAK